MRTSLVQKWGKGEKFAGCFAEFLGEEFAVEKCVLHTDSVENFDADMTSELLPPDEEWGELPDELKATLPKVINPTDQRDRILRFVGRAVEAHEIDELAFQARQLIQTTLPHRNPPAADLYVRKNGNASLLIQSGRDKDGKHIGIPYGATARLLLSFITREAIRKKERHITLGSTLTEFCREVGLDPTHGNTMRTVREQLRRLLSCSIVFISTREMEGGGYEERLNLPVATFARLWFWSRGKATPDQLSMFGDSEVFLNADFYDAIIKSPVPLKLAVLSALRASPLAIDIYAWAKYRCFVAKERTVISWWLLGEQFGHGYANIKDFKRYFKQAIAKVLIADPQIKIRVVRGGVEVTPARSRVRIAKPPLPSLDGENTDREWTDEGTEQSNE